MSQRGYGKSIILVWHFLNSVVKNSKDFFIFLDSLVNKASDLPESKNPEETNNDDEEDDIEQDIEGSADHPDAYWFDNFELRKKVNKQKKKY